MGFVKRDYSIVFKKYTVCSVNQNEDGIPYYISNNSASVNDKVYDYNYREVGTVSSVGNASFTASINGVPTTLYIRQQSAMIDLYSNMGAHLLEVDYPENVSFKECPSREWYDEDGDDVVLPYTQKRKSYEFTCKIGVSNNSASPRAGLKAKINAFISYASQNPMFLMYIPKFDKGVVASCVEIYDIDEFEDNRGTYATFMMKFKVYDPTKNVTATITNNEITNLSF